jgi:hypothetical protein
MTASGETTMVIRWIFRYPAVFGVLGVAFAAMGFYFAIVSAQAYASLSNTPKGMTIAEAADQLTDQKKVNVELEDGQWDCDSISHSTSKNTKWSEALLIDEASRRVVIVMHSGHVYCDEFMAEPPAGIIERYKDSWTEDMINKNEMGAAQYRGYQFYHLCTNCNRNRERDNAILGLVMTVVGLSAYPISWYFASRRNPKVKWEVGTPASKPLPPLDPPTKK